jgi:hypothetical protein
MALKRSLPSSDRVPVHRARIRSGRKRACSALVCLLLGFSSVLQAAETEAADRGNPWEIEGWNVQFSLYTRHWDPSPEHNNDQNMVTVEARFQDEWLAGISAFDNSFYQPTQLVYVGKTWALLESPHWYVKLIGGLIHGYKEPYEDKIPFNGLGVAPAILPSLGFRHGHLVIEAHLAGLAAITVTAGVRF